MAYSKNAPATNNIQPTMYLSIDLM